MYSFFYGLGENKIIPKYGLRSNFPENLKKVWKHASPLNELFSLLGDDYIVSNMARLVEVFQGTVINFSSHEKMQKTELFQNHTLLHGDFHGANLYLGASQENPRRILVGDWQAYGYGHPTTELAYFLTMSVKFDPTNDAKLREVYYKELTNDFGRGTLVKPEEYPKDIFEREMAVRTIGIAASFASLFLLDTPEKRDKRCAGNKKLQYLDDVAGPVLINSFRRSFHLIDTKDVQKFIQGE